MLRQRVLTALVLAPLGLAAVLWLPAEQFQLLIAALFGLGAYEWCQFVSLRSTAPRIAIGLTVGLLILVLQRSMGLDHPWWPAAAGLGLWGLGTLWLRWRDFGDPPSLISNTAKAVFGLLAFVLAALAVSKLTTDSVSRGWFVSMLFIIWGADVGAYFVGKALGRTKLAPSISPSKTWEGVWGGQLLVLIICLVAAYLFELDIRQTVGLAVAGSVTAAISVVGDLLVSLMKRHVGLKDAGRLLPGHGGVLDRFDSLIAAAPAFALSHSLLHL